MPKGHFVRSEAHKRHIAEALRGIKRSDETKGKISAVKTGLVYSEASREKRRKWNLENGAGKYARTKDVRQKASQSHRGQSSQLNRYGIDATEYAAQRRAGNGKNILDSGTEYLVT